MSSQAGYGGSSWGGYEPGIILVSHCLLFSNQLLSSAGPWKRVNEGREALECQGAVRGEEIEKKKSSRMERKKKGGYGGKRGGIEFEISGRERERSGTKSQVSWRQAAQRCVPCALRCLFCPAHPLSRVRPHEKSCSRPNWQFHCSRSRKKMSGPLLRFEQHKGVGSKYFHWQTLKQYT